MTKKTFLVCVDGSSWQQSVLDALYDLARADSANVALLHVVHKGGDGDGDGDADKTLAAAEQAVKAKGFANVTTYKQHHSDVAKEIATQAKNLSADYIVLGSHGRSGVKRALLGSVAEHVMRASSCPVVVVHKPELAEVAEKPLMDVVSEGTAK